MTGNSIEVVIVNNMYVNSSGIGVTVVCSNIIIVVSVDMLSVTMLSVIFITSIAY